MFWGEEGRIFVICYREKCVTLGYYYMKPLRLGRIFCPTGWVIDGELHLR